MPKAKTSKGSVVNSEAKMVVLTAVSIQEFESTSIMAMELEQ